ncbi:MAG: CcoQ/FixQ family Cbb3-type cytochrome c oxidase assembly chaperone [Crocinitomicaceae bacterium]
MLSYIKGHLNSIDGVEIFPIISFIIFFSFFVGLIIYVLKADKKKIDIIKNIPLDDKTDTL